MWDNIRGGFLDHLDEINRDLEAASLPALEKHVGFGVGYDYEEPTIKETMI